MLTRILESPPPTIDLSAVPSRPPTVIIKPSSRWQSLNLPELWNYREMIYFLAQRDVKVRYKQTVLGVAWALIQPLLGMAIFTVFLGRLAKMPSDGLPYALFAYIGFLPWSYFSNATNNAATSLVVNEKLISKVYFPRLVVPIATILASLVDFAIGFVLLIGMLVFFKTSPSPWAPIAVPLLILLTFIVVLGCGAWLSALDVQYRDVRYAVPFLIQVGLFATPVVYPASLIPSQFRAYYGLNPMAGVVEGFRWALGSNTNPPIALLCVSAAMALGLFVSGVWYFRHTERTFADII
jgi:lipopolysaccharide transport system permease protein